MNVTAVQALAKAQVELDFGGTAEALAYAMIAIAATALSDEEREYCDQEYESLMKKRQRVI